MKEYMGEGRDVVKMRWGYMLNKEVLVPGAGADRPRNPVLLC
jgi:hypothetical protein